LHLVSLNLVQGTTAQEYELRSSATPFHRQACWFSNSPTS